MIFPYCVRQFEEEYEIVFQNLKDFRIGLPADIDIRKSLLDKIGEAMTAIHNCGIVHLDFYLSNFMWREIASKEVEVRVIDFDSGHFIIDGLTGPSTERLKGNRDTLADMLPGMKSDLRNYDKSLYNLLLQHKDDSELQSDQKSLLDRRFTRLINESVLTLR
jgi:hypothetical protein